MKYSFAAIALVLNLSIKGFNCEQEHLFDNDESFHDDHATEDSLDEDMFLNGRPHKCYALALSDATNLGPYQAGVIQGLVHELKYTSGASGTMYEVVSGVALGAINAHIFSQFKLGQEEAAVEKLQDFWLTLADRNDKIINPWSWGGIYGFFYEQSLFDAQKLYDFIEEYFSDSTFHRCMYLGIADVLNGRFKSFRQTHGSDELISVL